MSDTVSKGSKLDDNREASSSSSSSSSSCSVPLTDRIPKRRLCEFGGSSKRIKEATPVVLRDSSEEDEKKRAEERARVDAARRGEKEARRIEQAKQRRERRETNLRINHNGGILSGLPRIFSNAALAAPCIHVHQVCKYLNDLAFREGNTSPQNAKDLARVMGVCVALFQDYHKVLLQARTNQETMAEFDIQVDITDIKDTTINPIPGSRRFMLESESKCIWHQIELRGRVITSDEIRGTVVNTSASLLCVVARCDIPKGTRFKYWGLRLDTSKHPMAKDLMSAYTSVTDDCHVIDANPKAMSNAGVMQDLNIICYIQKPQPHKSANCVLRVMPGANEFVTLFDIKKGEELTSNEGPLDRVGNIDSLAASNHIAREVTFISQHWLNTPHFVAGELEEMEKAAEKFKSKKISHSRMDIRNNSIGSC
jgi:hypothetical protein